MRPCRTIAILTHPPPPATTLLAPQARLLSLWQRRSSAGLHLSLQLSFSAAAQDKGGAPPIMWLSYTLPEHPGALAMQAVWQDKRPTVQPEAMFLQFAPGLGGASPTSWRMTKLASEIAPHEVVVNGSQHLHAVADDGITCTDPSGRLRLRVASPDVALVSMGSLNPFPTLTPPTSWPAALKAHGASYMLLNTMWGTNYPLWVPYSERGANMAFRFEISVEPTVDKASPAAGGAGGGAASKGNLWNHAAAIDTRFASWVHAPSAATQSHLLPLLSLAMVVAAAGVALARFCRPAGFQGLLITSVGPPVGRSKQDSGSDPKKDDLALSGARRPLIRSATPGTYSDYI